MPRGYDLLWFARADNIDQHKYGIKMQNIYADMRIHYTLIANTPRMLPCRNLQMQNRLFVISINVLY